MAILLTSCATLPSPEEKPIQKQRLNEDEIILDKSYFTIIYSKQYAMPKRVEYALRAEDLKKPKVQRQDKFFTDPELVAMGIDAITPADYKNSGYDRGHLAPSADFAWSSEANDATFVMTNMLPLSPHQFSVKFKNASSRVQFPRKEEWEV